MSQTSRQIGSLTSGASRYSSMVSGLPYQYDHGNREPYLRASTTTFAMVSRFAPYRCTYTLYVSPIVETGPKMPSGAVHCIAPPATVMGLSLLLPFGLCRARCNKTY